MPKVRCDKCNGIGEVEVEDDELPCEATIVVGAEEPIRCYASRKHPGWPHMAILAWPCAACGAFEEHHDTCAVYPADEVRFENVWASTWWYLGQAWRDAFQPDSPWATHNRAEVA
jgi:hypothetical protein